MLPSSDRFQRLDLHGARWMANFSQRRRYTMCIFTQCILLIKDNKVLGIEFSSHQILLMLLVADGVGIFQDSPDEICMFFCHIQCALMYLIF